MTSFRAWRQARLAAIIGDDLAQTRLAEPKPIKPDPARPKQTDDEDGVLVTVEERMFSRDFRAWYAEFLSCGHSDFRFLLMRTGGGNIDAGDCERACRLCTSLRPRSEVSG